jgi:hypothetical protein
MSNYTVVVFYWDALTTLSICITTWCMILTLIALWPSRTNKKFISFLSYTQIYMIDIWNQNISYCLKWISFKIIFYFHEIAFFSLTLFYLAYAKIMWIYVVFVLYKLLRLIIAYIRSIIKLTNHQFRCQQSNKRTRFQEHKSMTSHIHISLRVFVERMI